MTEMAALRLVRSLARSGSLASIRTATDMTVTEAAKASGASRRSIYRWERNQTVPHGAGAVRYGLLLDRVMRGER